METKLLVSCFRKEFLVDSDVFLQPEVNFTKVIEVITIGRGFFMLPQLFSRQEIKHARELILHLIKKQGKKATHFQVNY